MKFTHTLFSWLITCTGGSILLLISIFLLESSNNFISHNSAEAAIAVLFYGIIGSMLLFIPAFILYHLLGVLLYRNISDRTLSKTLLSCYAVLAPLLSLWLIALAFTGERNLFRRGGDPEVLYILLPYTIGFVACIWLYGPQQRPGTPGNEAAESDNGFPAKIAAGITIIVLASEVWNLFNIFKYWQYYHITDRIVSPLIMAVHIAGLFLLLRRKNAGWYILSALAVWFTLSSVLSAGYAFTQKPEHLKAYLNIAWVFFFLLETARLVLLMLPPVRRYFRVTPERLGAVVIAGVLLAAAFFFARL